MISISISMIAMWQYLQTQWLCPSSPFLSIIVSTSQSNFLFSIVSFWLNCSLNCYSCCKKLCNPFACMVNTRKENAPSIRSTLLAYIQRFLMHMSMQRLWDHQGNVFKLVGAGESNGGRPGRGSHRTNRQDCSCRAGSHFSQENTSDFAGSNWKEAGAILSWSPFFGEKKGKVYTFRRFNGSLQM